MVGVLGGGAEKEGKVFMRGSAGGKTGDLGFDYKFNKKAALKLYIVDPVYWVKDMKPKQEVR